MLNKLAVIALIVVFSTPFVFWPEKAVRVFVILMLFGFFCAGAYSIWTTKFPDLG